MRPKLANKFSLPFLSRIEYESFEFLEFTHFPQLSPN